VVIPLAVSGDGNAAGKNGGGPPLGQLTVDSGAAPPGPFGPFRPYSSSHPEATRGVYCAVMHTRAVTHPVGPEYGLPLGKKLLPSNGEHHKAEPHDEKVANGIGQEFVPGTVAL